MESLRVTLTATAVCLSLVSLVACGSGTSEHRGSHDAVLRAVVEVAYQSEDLVLDFKPGELDFGTEPWLTHEVTFDIWTDEWIQHLSVHDRYVANGGELVPDEGADEQDYVLSDDGPSGGHFEVALGELSEGEHRFSLAVPVLLEPQPRHQGSLQPEELIFSLDFVYDVFWAESPLETFCVRADQLLWTDQATFAPQSFIEAGEDALNGEQIAAFKREAEIYSGKADTGYWDPGPFFDLIEQICDVTYDERWASYS